MASKLSITVKGIPEFERRAKEVVERMNSEGMQDRLMPAAMMVRDLARRLVGIGHGNKNGKHLQDAIFAVKGKRATGRMVSFAAALRNGEEGPSVIVGVDRKREPEAHLVEYGHGGPHPAPAHPFMRPAAQAARPAIVSIVTSAVKQILAPYTK